MNDDSERFYYSRFNHAACSILLLAFPRAVDSPFRDIGLYRRDNDNVGVSMPLL